MVHESETRLTTSKHYNFTAGEKKLNYQKSKQLNSQGSGRYGRLMCVANCHKKGDNRQE